ncbi:MAG: purine-binding chemotaxis protein CheW [Gammaproteobacteria bacterium]|nr:purine-binding chemotaxis protein CheW [Gammaproteobacteria bacterium]
MAGHAVDPFDLFAELDARAQACASPLPSQEEVKERWTGVGFSLDGIHYVTPLNEVAEILTPPSLTRVPGAKPWVRGIANVRGMLLPVMDLHGFFGRSARPAKTQRILVINHESVFSGVVVDEIQGLQHFDYEQGVEVGLPEDDPRRPYLAGGFQRGDRLWSIFSLHALAENESFIQVAQ